MDTVNIKSLLLEIEKIKKMKNVPEDDLSRIDFSYKDLDTQTKELHGNCNK